MRNVAILVEEAYGAEEQIADRRMDMDIKWNYKIDLSDPSVFREIERKRGITIPKELKELIIQGNAATPEKYKFMIHTTEHVLGAMLSFNKGEKDTDTVFSALDVITDSNLFPFAIDPFGNYICLDIKNGEVAFWEHETGRTVLTGQKLIPFFEKLY